MAARSPESAGSDKWRVQMLGTFKVTRRQVTASFATRKAAGMLAYLAYYSGRSVPRDVLAGVFWPDSESERGRQSVRNALTQLRGGLKADGVDVESLFIASSGTVECPEDSFFIDAVDFRRVAEAAATRPESLSTEDMTAAFELYLGPFLPGFDEDWVVPQLLDLEELYVGLTDRLCDRLIAEGTLEQAVATARKAVTVCPLREECHIALMKAYAAEGRSAAVLRQFETLEKMMDAEWGEPPSTAAVHVLESLPTAEKAAVRPMVGGSGASKPTGGRLFGRDEALEELVGLLQPDGPVRLLTLVGLGGFGKTALAEQVMAALSALYPGRAWTVPMVSLQSALEIPDAVIDAVGGRPSGTDPLDAMARALGPGPGLLLFDNVEQLLPAAKTVIDGLLERHPAIRILATSRLPTCGGQERLWPIRPVALPRDPRDLVRLRENPSVRMLVDRAQAARPGFAVTPVTARSVYELCHRLEGVPLAIAIAATHLATQSPAQLLGSLGRRLDLGAFGESVPDRHRSLRAVVAWNHERLAEPIKDAFERLSVCRGGFNADLARTIVGDRADTVLRDLVACGLLAWSETLDDLRFEPLETVREYVAHELAERPEAYREAVVSHFGHCLSLAQDPSATTDPAEWSKRLESDLANVLEALNNAAAGYVPAEDAWTLAISLRELIRRRGRSHVWADAFSRLLDKTDASLSEPIRAEAHLLLAQTHYGMRDIAATYRHCLEAVNAADRAEVDRLRASARIEMAAPGTLLGKFDEVRAHLETARSILKGLGDLAGLTDCENNLGWLEFDSGNVQAAEETLRTGLAHAEASGSDFAIAEVSVAYGSALGPERYGEAVLCMERALAIREVLGYPQQIAHALYYRAFLDYRSGKSEEACGRVRRALELFVANGIRLGQTPLSIAGLVFAGAGFPNLAAAFWGRALESCRRYGMQMFPIVKSHYEAERERVVKAIGAIAFEAEAHRGATADDEALLAMVSALESPTHLGETAESRL